MQDPMTPQYSAFKERQYQLELEYCMYYKRNDAQADHIRSQINSLRLENCLEWGAWTQRELQSVFDIYRSISLSSRTLHNLASMDANGLSDITTTSFSEAISYVSDITGLDLCNVQEVRLSHYESAYSEGECVSCNVDNHHIYYSLDSNQVSSIDMLCHEVGHAADFISARRDSTDDRVLYRHRSLEETVAHYCQFRYLQDHGSPINRKGSLGAFIYTYLAYLVCCYCIDNKILLDQLEPVEVIENELFRSLVDAYVPAYGPELAKVFLAEKIYETQIRFQSLGNLIYEELNPRLGIPLGLALLGIEDLDLSRVSTMNFMSVELEQVLQAIDQRLLERLSDMDTLVANFIGETDEL